MSRRCSRRRARGGSAASIAGLALLGLACTTTYGPGDLEDPGPIRTPVCGEAGEMSDDPGCGVDDPICTDPSDARCAGTAG